MANRVYSVVINLLLFFFVTNVITGVSIRGGNLLATVLVGIAFGLLMTLVPNMLQFFKITVNSWSALLLSVVLSFLFLFILTTLQVATFTATVIDLGIPGLVIALGDAIATILFLAFLLGAASVGLTLLERR